MFSHPKIKCQLHVIKLTRLFVNEIDGKFFLICMSLLLTSIPPDGTR